MCRALTATRALRRPGALALLASLALVSCAGSDGSDGGSSGGSGSTPEVVPAGFAPPSKYVPEPGLLTEYWKRHYTDAVGTVGVVIELGTAAHGGERLGWQVAPESTAVEGLHWTSTAPGTLVLPAGAHEVVLPIEVLPRGVFFLEKRLRLELVPVENVEIDPDAAAVEVWIRPAAPPPTIDVVAAQTKVASAGDQVAVDFQVDGGTDEAVRLFWKVEGDLASHLTGPEPGSVVLPPGTTTERVVFEYDGLADPAASAVVVADYERDGVVRSLELDDGSIQEMHVDENLWTFSEGLPEGLEATEADPFIPAWPTNLHPGGVPMIDEGPVAEILPQQDPSPILDPFTGEALAATTPTLAASGFPYIRNSFHNTFCNGPAQLITLDAWVRTSYYLAKFHGDDFDLNTTFHRAGVRVRSQDLDHAVIFRSDSPGFDHDGNPVPVLFTSQGDFGVWLTGLAHPDDEWGAFEDEYGVGIYFIHHLDPSYVWPGGGIEVPGVDYGNPIHYPTWYVPGDGSEIQGPMHSMRGRGTLAYGFWLEMSDTPLSGPPERVWPKFGNWWEPRGNAAMPMAHAEHVVEVR